MSKAFRVITNPGPQPPSVEGSVCAGLAERVQRLQAEAEQLAREHIGVLTASLVQTQRVAEEIAVGREAYPAGVRDLARQLAEDSRAKAQTIEAILSRRPPAGAPAASLP